MRVGIIVGRMGGVDGVALETEKWIDVLKEEGHEPYLLCGEFERDVLPKDQQTTFEPLSFFSEECVREQDECFFNPDPKSDGTKEAAYVDANAAKAEKAIGDWVNDKVIDLIISENSNALPCHLSMGKGIADFIRKNDFPAITHDHDWSWERGDRYKTPFKQIEQVKADNFPLIYPTVAHAVINTNAQNTLNERFDQESTYVPNVMDFRKPFGQKDDYNATLRADFGIAEDDKLLCQVTRMVPRKNIENAIEAVGRLKDPKVKLLITGDDKDDTDNLVPFLKEEIKKWGVENQVIFGGDRIKDFRGETDDGKKIYNISDSHAVADANTYFSSYEGWGNAFAEGVQAGNVQFVNNYKPVYWPDIGSKGFKTVQIEDNKVTDEAVEKMRVVLNNKELRQKWGEYNYELGKKEFSYDVLRKKINSLMDKATQKGQNKEGAKDQSLPLAKLRKGSASR